MALACLATTLVLADDVAVCMPKVEDRISLLRDVAGMLDVGELVEDADLLLCPVERRYKDPYLKAMEFLAMVVWETMEKQQRGEDQVEGS